MDEKVDIKKLKQSLKSVKLLYVEDNEGLLKKVSDFFNKLFDEVHQAKNGKEGYELFKEHRPDIIITDIQMPGVDGLEMVEAIRKLDKTVKIVITTAYDDKEYLLKTIDLGVVGYLKKPIMKDALIDILYKITQDIEDNKNKNTFNDYLNHIFNNKHSLFFMIKNNEIVLANNNSFKFLGLNNLDEFREKFKDFGSLLLPHETFLWESDDIDYLQELKTNPGKLFNVKILDTDNSPHHLLLKSSIIEDEDDSFVISMQDVTELNLLGLYDKNTLEHDKDLRANQEKEEVEQDVLNLLQAAMDSQAQINVHNFYKGLCITHAASIIEVTEEKVVFKTVHLQQKAITIENKVILTSDFFPFDIESDNLLAVDSENLTTKITYCKMKLSSPTMRKSITLDADPTDKVTLFYNKRQVNSRMHIINLSIHSIRISLKSLPTGLKIKDQVSIHIMLNRNTQPVIADTQAEVFRVFEYENDYEIVLKFKVGTSIDKVLVDYISKRQMKLIREFKGLRYE